MITLPRLVGVLGASLASMTQGTRRAPGPDEPETGGSVFGRVGRRDYLLTAEIHFCYPFRLS